MCTSFSTLLRLKKASLHWRELSPQHLFKCSGCWSKEGRPRTSYILQVAKRDDLRTIFESLDLAGGLINLEDGATFPVMNGFEDFEDYLDVWLFS